MFFIRIILVSVLFLGPFIRASTNDGYISLFNGSTLDGWDGDPRFWRVEKGSIVGETTTSRPSLKNTYLIWNGGLVDDFDLKIEFKLRNHNSGIQYRSFPLDGERWIVGGYQADISEDPAWMGAAWSGSYKNLLAKTGDKTVVGETSEDLEVVAQVGDLKEIAGAINLNDWNTYHITARGSQCIHRVNGIQTAEFSESSIDRLTSGLLALQLHSGPPMEVRFRNIKLRPIKAEDSKEILFLAGKKSHGYGAHEHKAGCHLLARCINESDLAVSAQVVTEGKWPEPWTGYRKPDCVVMYCDGFRRHMAKSHQDKIQSLVDAGVGVACLHFGVEVEPLELGSVFLDWIGGYFEIGWSVNPTWEAQFNVFPEHPITRGVVPFSIRDEWYYHMRFKPNMEGVTPILSTIPPVETLILRADDKKRGINPTVLSKVQLGEAQHMAWAYERPSGGRGFGFTGGHFHNNWKEDNFRMVVLNALLWCAHGQIPTFGVPSRTPSDIDLTLNQDFPKPSTNNKSK